MLADELIQLLGDAIQAAPPFSKESEVHVALALGLRLRGVGRIWASKTVSDSLGDPSIRRTRIVGLTKYPDLSWATGQDGPMPDVIGQIKFAGSLQPTQEPALYLGDIAFAGLDFARLKAGEFFTAAVIEKVRFRRYWGHLVSAQGGTFTLVLDPSSCKVDEIDGRTWVSPEGIARPYTRGDYNRIFCAGTNGKFLGLWHRPGTFTIVTDTRCRETEKYWVLLHVVRQARLDSELPLELWWP